MTIPTVPFRNVTASLADLVGEAYIDAVCDARAVLSGEDTYALRVTAREPIDFLPEAFQARLEALLPRVGERIDQALGRPRKVVALRQVRRQCLHTDTQPATLRHLHSRSSTQARCLLQRRFQRKVMAIATHQDWHATPRRQGCHHVAERDVIGDVSPIEPDLNHSRGMGCY